MVSSRVPIVVEVCTDLKLSKPSSAWGPVSAEVGAAVASGSNSTAAAAVAHRPPATAATKNPWGSGASAAWRWK